jgi:sigma-B regulation protein RsbU (phosphoserine phosphatase)
MEEQRDRRYPLARAIHDALIPPDVPEIPGVSLSLRAHYGEQETNVGGDFADVFEIGEVYGLAWGDISGRGREAASLAVMAKYMLRALAFRDFRPASVAYHLNRVLEYTLGSEHFVTLVYAAYDPRSRELTIANCGAWAPLLVRGDRVVPVDVRGPLLGAIPDQQYNQVQLGLEPGDMVVGFTDGIPEAHSDGEVMGVEPVEKILLEHFEEGHNVLTHLVMEAARQFSGGTLRDDAVVLAMGVPSSEDGSSSTQEAEVTREPGEIKLG